MPRDFKFDAGDKATSVLVGSLSTDNPGNIAAQQINVYFRKLGEAGLRVGVTVYDHCTPGSSSTDFPDRCGKLFAIVLPAGDYALESWNITDNAGVLGPRDWRPVTFTVQAGKINYVGEIHMIFNRNLPGHGPLEWRGWPVASDAHARDIPMILSRHPMLKQSDVTMALLRMNPPGELCVIGEPAKRSNTLCN